MNRDRDAGIIALGIVLLAWLLLRAGLMMHIADGIGGLLTKIVHRCIGHE